MIIIKTIFAHFSFLYLAGSAFDITQVYSQRKILPPTSSPTQHEQKEEPEEDNIGNFDITIDDLFQVSQTSHLSPTLQMNEVRSQARNVFDDDDDGIDDDELLEAFNKHMEPSSTSNQITNPSPVLVLTNRVNTQCQSTIPTADTTLPKFDLEFSFDDLDNSDEATNNVLDT